MWSPTSSRAGRHLWGSRSLGPERPKASEGRTWICPWAASASLRQNEWRAVLRVQQRPPAVAHGFLECRLPAVQPQQTTNVPDRPLTIGRIRREPATSVPSDLATPDETIRRCRLLDLPC